jgi:hypothetical protein
MNSSIQDIIQFVASLATPFIALIAVYYTRTQARTNEIRRKQELFNLRYAFYRKVREAYLSIAQSSQPVDTTDFFDLAEEASFLFSDDVAKHIVSIADRKIEEQVKYGIIDNWFVKPFKKYLQLK